MLLPRTFRDHKIDTLYNRMNTSRQNVTFDFDAHICGISEAPIHLYLARSIALSTICKRYFSIPYGQRCDFQPAFLHVYFGTQVCLAACVQGRINASAVDSTRHDLSSVCNLFCRTDRITGAAISITSFRNLLTTLMLLKSLCLPQETVANNDFMGAVLHDVEA